MEENKQEYLKVKAEYQKVIRRTKAEYFRGKLSDKSNPRAIWGVINEATNRCKKADEVPGKFMVNGVAVKGKKNIANAFNEYYSTIANKLEQDLPRPKGTEPEIKRGGDFTFREVSCYDVIKLIKSLKSKSSSSTDLITNKLVKELQLELAQPLKRIINFSIQSGRFPEEWKKAKIVPIFKKGERRELGNYRPVSLLPVLSKVMEKVMVKQMMEFFETNGLMNQNQFGFRGGHSTEHAIVELISKVEEIKKKKKVPVVVYIDFRKAFDTLDYRVAMEKFRKYGFKESAIGLLESYLKGRKQTVQIGQEFADWIDTPEIGCPQGSCLGPCLFILYVNDMMSLGYSVLFADDTAIVLECDRNSPIEQQCEERLNKYKDWFVENRLSLHMGKTVVQIMDRGSHVVKMGGEEIKRVKDKEPFRYLGVELQENGGWESHIKKIRDKARAGSFALHSVKNILPKSVKKIIYDSLIKSHLTYGISAWYKSAKKKDVKSLETIQKKAVRSVCRAKFNSHTEDLMKANNILKLNDLARIGALQCGWKVKSMGGPWALEQRIKKRESNTRTRGELYAETPLLDQLVRESRGLLENKETKITAREAKKEIRGVMAKMTQSYQTICNKNDCFSCKDRIVP